MLNQGKTNVAHHFESSLSRLLFMSVACAMAGAHVEPDFVASNAQQPGIQRDSAQC